MKAGNMRKVGGKKKGREKRAPAKKLTRKEARKQKQVQKKENKRLFFAGKVKTTTEQAALPPAPAPATATAKRKRTKQTAEQWLSGQVASGDDESIASDFSDEEVDARIPKSIKRLPAAVPEPPPPPPPQKKKKKEKHNMPDAAELHRRELQRKKELEQASRKQRMKQLKLENEEEEKMISRLEKKLKLNKTKDKNRLVRKMFSDGLDYALEFCLDDEEEREKRALKEKRKQERQSEMDSWSDGLDEFENGGGSETDNAADDDGDVGETDIEESDGTMDDSNDEDADEADTKASDEFTEDIYGRKRDKDGNLVDEQTPQAASDGGDGGGGGGVATGKYIPPHQRALLAAQGDDKLAQQLERLRKHCKGLLNRLSTANLHKIATGIEELYMRNSRNNMNATLTKLLNEALIGATIASERMVQEHMVLLAYLHAHVGSEIGAHFLQTYIEQFDRWLRDVHTLAVEDKRLNNLVLVLAYLYIFKIYEHRLLLEIIERLSGSLCEKTIECLLLIFQSVGFKLRKDDPLAFKQMMLAVQKRIADSPMEMKENLRLKFMVDILNAVKNNNINKIPQFDPELAENLRKQLKGMLRNDRYVVTLNITIDDLLRADHVGKWWVVGSAWSGNIKDLGAASSIGDPATNSDASARNQRFSEKLLQLAKQQKMNTDERRSIFCIIMSAEDYVDAFEKILHLSLKDQRTIAYVIIHCCLNEKRSNPYYSHLALKFCNYNRKFQLAFQFASWDRINDIEALAKQQIRNLAKFLEYLVLSGGLVLSVLKVVNFLQLDKLSFLFMREIMLGLLLHADEKETYLAFERVAKNAKLQQFKNSVRLFMQHFLLRDDGAKLKLPDDQLALLKRRVEYVDNILAYVDL